MINGLLGFLQILFYYPIFNALMFLNWLVHDFGLSIVLLTLLIRAAMIPLTRKQLKSQRRMMDLQPQLAALKEQYKGDQQGFAKAQMQLMRENNVSMFGGCLPLLIQMPFLYGLFYALRSGLGGSIADIQNNLYPFMHFTLNHGKPDTFLRWFEWIPVWHPILNLNVPDPTHVLPILAALFTFASVRMIQGNRQQQQVAQASKSSDPKTAAQQNAQTQMMGAMTYITPLFTLFFAWQYAAGLALYWTVSTLFGIGQQYLITGWGGLFKGIPPLHNWAKEQDAKREARRLEKRQAESSTAGNLVEGAASAFRSLLASGTNGAKNGAASSAIKGQTKEGATQEAKSEDWIEEAKTKSLPPTNKKKERPRPFVTLVKQEPSGITANLSNGDNGAGAGAANGSATTGTGAATSAKPNASTGSIPKGNTPTNTPKTGTPPAKRKVPPRSGSVPKPKGGKK